MGSRDWKAAPLSRLVSRNDMQLVVYKTRHQNSVVSETREVHYSKTYSEDASTTPTSTGKTPRAGAVAKDKLESPNGKSDTETICARGELLPAHTTRGARPARTYRRTDLN